MKLIFRNLLCVFFLVGSVSSIHAGRVDTSPIKQMNTQQKLKLKNYLLTQRCTCGCNLTVSVCLRTHKTCDHSPKMATSAMQAILASGPAQTRQPPFQPKQARVAGNLNPALFGVWRRRTMQSSGSLHLNNTKKISFSRNGIAAYGSGAHLGGSHASVSVLSKSNSGVEYGRWTTNGNTLHINWQRSGKVAWAYKVFRHNGSYALKLGSLYYKLVRR